MHKFNIKNARYQNDYKIFLTFDDGVEGVVDLRGFLFDGDCGVFMRLRDVAQFRDFRVEDHTLAWGKDLDLAPEFLRGLVGVVM